MSVKPITCSRCGSALAAFYPIEHEYEDMNEHTVKEQWFICWDCSFDIMNGGDTDDDVYDIIQRRRETDYAFDPLYYPEP